MTWYDSRNGMMSGTGYTIFSSIVIVVLFVVMVWIIIKIIEHGAHISRNHESSNHDRSSSAAMDHLNMRLATGEISVEDYTILKEHLLK
jgi:uncharacterized membrane protein